MGDVAGLALAGVAGNTAGGMLGNALTKGSGGPDPMRKEIDFFSGLYQQTLQTALGDAIKSATQGTNQAEGQLNTSLGTASDILNQATGNAGQLAQQQTNYGFNLGQSLLAPQRTAGYNASDAYNQLLGINTPQGGSANLAQQGQNLTALKQLLAQYGGSAPTAPGAAPTAPVTDLSTYQQQLTPKQIQDYIAAHESKTGNLNPYSGLQYTDPNGTISQQALVGNTFANTGDASGNAIWNQQIQDSATKSLAQDALTKAQADYQKQLDAYNASQKTYNQFGQQFNALGLTPAQIAQYNQNTGQNLDYSSLFQQFSPDQWAAYQQQLQNQQNNPPSNNPPASNNALQNFQNSAAYQNLYGNTQSTSADPLTNFFNSPAYQLLYGTNATSTDPTQRFKQDPGYQYQQNEAARQLSQQYAAKGLLESGPILKALQTQAQGIADQGYQTWLGQQNQLFNTDQATKATLMQNYANQLSGLNTLGTQITGANTAANMYGNLGNLLSGQTYNTGTTLFGGNQQTGSDLASLMANLGIYSGNAQLSTGAARAQGYMSQLSAIMQEMGMQQAAQANQASGQATNQGFLQGANQVSGLMGGYYPQGQPGTYVGGQLVPGTSGGYF